MFKSASGMTGHCGRSSDRSPIGPTPLPADSPFADKKDRSAAVTMRYVKKPREWMLGGGRAAPRHPRGYDMATTTRNNDKRNGVEVFEISREAFEQMAHDVEGRLCARRAFDKLPEHDCYVVVKSWSWFGEQPVVVFVNSHCVYSTEAMAVSEAEYRSDMALCDARDGYTTSGEDFEVWHVVDGSDDSEDECAGCVCRDCCEVCNELNDAEAHEARPSYPFPMASDGSMMFAALRGLYDVDLLTSLLFDDSGMRDSRGRHFVTWADASPEYIATVLRLCYEG